MELLLLTDSFPNENGAGISQTLFNLLDGWPHGCSVLLSAKEPVPENGNLEAKAIRYSDGPWQPMQNRLGRYLNKWLQSRRMQWLQKNGLKGVVAQLPAPSNCLVLVSTTVPEKIMAGRWLQQMGYRVIPYFMDDWMWGSTLRWNGGGLSDTICKLLHEAPACMMISRQLHQTLFHRCQLASKPWLVVHNPAPPVQMAVGNLPLEGEADDENDTSRKLPTTNCELSNEQMPTAIRQLIYAGSIWPMHANALVAVAAAIHALNAKGEGSFELRIYTSPSHWQQHRPLLEGNGVSYAGWKPYAKIHKELAGAWLLVCTASFDEAHAAYSASSVQTKLTDYMAAGKPVLFVGPAGAASGQFVEEHDVGFTLATNSAADIAERLLAISALPVQYRRKCTNALREAGTRFSQAAVQQRLYAFLEEVGRG
jgi:glycosyltransferase involved in cell wall biosynthesis